MLRIEWHKLWQKSQEKKCSLWIEYFCEKSLRENFTKLLGLGLGESKGVLLCKNGFDT